MGPIGWSETSVKDYYSTLRYTPEQRRSHQHRGGSLKSRSIILTFFTQSDLFFPGFPTKLLRLLNMVVNFGVLQTAGNSLKRFQTLAWGIIKNTIV
jgi:hypothetical protein